MTRANIIATGLMGLVGAIVVIGMSLSIVVSNWIPILLTRPIIIWTLFLVLLFFSVAEIPLMVYSMRRIAASTNPKAGYLVLLTNTGYTFFAGVYAAPFILLAGRSTLELVAGVLLGSLAFVRFISTLIFLPK
ncbi:MAG: hypothetical protein KDJ52_03080 [Anaerolineae bacterium]|nr:hypothetical protein [Anaerolineae bacterium]